MMKPRIKISNLVYYPIQKRWSKIGPIFHSKECEKVWRSNMVEYLEQRASENGYKYVARSFAFPSDCDSCDWRYNRKGKHPAYFNFVCHSACHWLVDMCLFVAMKVHPEV